MIAFAVMEKRAGFGTEYPAELRNGDWEYAVFNPARVLNEKANYKACFGISRSQSMRHSMRSIASILLAVMTLAACDGGNGGQSTASSGGTATPAAPPSPPSRGEAGDGGSGGSGGSGGASASLNTTRFRTVTVIVTPPNGGTVSDNFEDHGSRVQHCTSCSERYQLGTRVVLAAGAAPGYVFDRWNGTFCQGSTSPTCALVIDQDARVTAVFRR